MARTPRRARNAGGSQEYDFSGIQDRGAIEPAWYHSKITKPPTLEQGNEHPYWKWIFEVVEDGDAKGRELYLNTSTAPNALWNFRNLLSCLGHDVSGKFVFDPKDQVNREVMLKTDLEDYQGKERTHVVDYASVEEDGVATSGYTEEDIEAMSLADLQGVIDEHPLKTKLGKSMSTNRAKVIEELQAGGLMAGENAEGGDTYTVDDIEAMSVSDLDELVKQHSLTVSKVRAVSVYRGKVIEALTEAGLISEEGATEEATVEGYTEDDIDGMNKADLEAVIKEHSLSVKPDKVLSRWKAAVIVELSGKGLMVETVEEVYTLDSIEALDKAGLEALVAKHELKVAPNKITSRYRTAVIDALEQAGLIADGDDATQEGYSEGAIDSMDMEELERVIADHELDIASSLKGSKRRLAVIEELRGKNLIVEDSAE